jgi:hypothetical protein
MVGANQHVAGGLLAVCQAQRHAAGNLFEPDTAVTGPYRSRRGLAHRRDFRMKLSDADVMKDIEAAADHLGGKKLGIVGIALAAPLPGGAPPGRPNSPRHPAGMAAVSPAPRAKAPTARCRCISARRMPRSR